MERIISRDDAGLIVSIVDQPVPSEDEIVERVWPKIQEHLLRPEVLAQAEPTVNVPVPARYLNCLDFDVIVDGLYARSTKIGREAGAECKWRRIEFWPREFGAAGPAPLTTSHARGASTRARRS